MQTCWVEQDEARHLRQLDAEDAINKAVEKRTTELMLPGAAFDPLNADNLSDAAGDWELCDVLFAGLADLLAKGMQESAGRLLEHTSRLYAAKQARKQAEQDVARGVA